jgi:hypothetical protein
MFKSIHHEPYLDLVSTTEFALMQTFASLIILFSKAKSEAYLYTLKTNDEAALVAERILRRLSLKRDYFATLDELATLLRGSQSLQTFHAPSYLYTNLPADTRQFARNFAQNCTVAPSIEQFVTTYQHNAIDCLPDTHIPCVPRRHRHRHAVAMATRWQGAAVQQLQFSLPPCTAAGKDHDARCYSNDTTRRRWRTVAEQLRMAVDPSSTR